LNHGQSFSFHLGLAVLLALPGWAAFAVLWFVMANGSTA